MNGSAVEALAALTPMLTYIKSDSFPIVAFSYSWGT